MSVVPVRLGSIGAGALCTNRIAIRGAAAQAGMAWINGCHALETRRTQKRPWTLTSRTPRGRDSFKRKRGQPRRRTLQALHLAGRSAYLTSLHTQNPPPDNAEEGCGFLYRTVAGLIPPP